MATPSGKDSPLYKHGHSKNPLFLTWRSMLHRCHSPKGGYYHRGIRVCERWHSFDNFESDMGKSYLEHRIKVNYQPFETQIDRIDSDKGYSPENCRWVTRKENIDFMVAKYKGVKRGAKRGSFQQQSAVSEQV